MTDKPNPKEPGFSTLAVHAGATPDSTTGARATPIYQTVGYVFDDADQAASLYNLQTFGYVYSRLGKRIPRVSHDQYVHAHKVGRNVRKGELVFFHSGSGRVYHVGIYAGRGRIWHAPRSGERVRLDRIWTQRWSGGWY